MKEQGSDNWKEANADLFDNSNTPLFTQHPNSLIDIAVQPLSGEYITNNNLEFPAFDIDKNALTSKELRDNGVEEGSTIYARISYGIGFQIIITSYLSPWLYRKNK